MEREGFEISHGSRRRIGLRLVCTGGGPRRLLEYLFVVESPLGAIEAALPSFSLGRGFVPWYMASVWKENASHLRVRVFLLLLFISHHVSAEERRGEETSSSQGM